MIEKISTTTSQVDVPDLRTSLAQTSTEDPAATAESASHRRPISNPSPRPRPTPRRSSTLRSLTLLALVTVGGLAIYWGVTRWGSGAAGESSDVPTAPVRLMNLRDRVVEQGDLESQSTVTGICEIDDHENKIIFLAPEGAQVKKGQVVCKFDTSEFDNDITERETRVNEATTEVENAEQEVIVQKDSNASAIREAKQTMEIAKLDLDKYIYGEYEVKKSDLKGAISEAKVNFNNAKRQLVNMRVLVKRGFRDYQQQRSKEQEVESTKLRLQRDEQKLLTLEKFEHVKSLAEFTGKHEESIHKYAVAQSTAKAKIGKAEDQLKNSKYGLRIQERRLKQLKEGLAKHVMTAPQDGTLAYASDNWRGNGEKLHEGSMIYRNQPVFVLPDMTKMQVKVGIHESLVSKVKPNQKATIRVEAFSSFALPGTVKSVSPLSASTRWEASNNYQVIVTIDKFPEGIKLKPGMTAEVEILVGEYPNVLAVPIQSVASFGRKKFVFVETGREYVPREVEIGNTNISFVEITSGLKENEVVALDAYQRAITEFGDQEPDEDDATDQLVTEMTPVEGGQVGLTSGEATESDLPPKPRPAESESDVPPKPAADSVEETESNAEGEGTDVSAESTLSDSGTSPRVLGQVPK
jgi:HlyD family secretion protein